MRRTGLGAQLSVAHDIEVGKTLPEAQGQCFRQAFLFVERFGSGGWELVHGELTGWAIHVQNFGEPYHHAWAEKDGMLYEPLHDLIYVKEFYESFAGPVEHVRFDKRKAIQQALANETYGPWEVINASD